MHIPRSKILLHIIGEGPHGITVSGATKVIKTNVKMVNDTHGNSRVVTALSESEIVKGFQVWSRVGKR